MQQVQEVEDPVVFTRERLAEIGQVWTQFAKQRVELYKGKLPEGLKPYLERKAAMPDAEAETADPATPEVATDPPPG